MEHEDYMALALELAGRAESEGEVPVGCVIVHEGEVIGRGYNRREHQKSALGHAELDAIAGACAALHDWRLDGCSLYVTLEPCVMCAGAIINARVKRVYFGARDRERGACGSVLNIFEEGFGHRPELVGGILSEECSSIISNFFKKIR